MKDKLNKYTDKAILERFFEIYPDQEKSLSGYRKVLKQLRACKPSKTTMVLYPRKWNTDAIDTKNGERYAIEFTKWEEWLSMPIKTKTSGLTALCYCLYEMTFCGFEQKTIQKEINKLNRIVKKIKKDNKFSE
jgi:hypothetical protein